MKSIVRQLVLAFSVLVMIVVNLSGGGGSFSGQKGTDIYSTFPTPVTPAPYTFAVWGPIFLGAIAFAVYQALPAHRKDARLDALGWPLTLTYLATAGTVFTPISVSVPVLLLVLAGLVWSFLTVVRLETAGRTFFWCVRAPVAVFFGWITVATILNVSQWLVSLGFTWWGITPALWSAALMLAAAALGVAIAARYREAVYPVVIAWALWGVVVGQSDGVLVLAAAVIGSIALLAAAARTFRRSTHGGVGMAVHS